jgi:hypothetical protein
MPLSPEQRQHVLDSIAAGRLPLESEHKMYAGHGDGHACAGCGEIIDQSMVEYEATYPDGRAYRLHLGCAAVWDAERRRRHDTTIGDAGRIQEQSQATRQWARVTSKESARIRDQADVLARKAEATINASKRVKRGERPE